MSQQQISEFKSAKDLGSAAVALSVMLAALTWGVLTAPLLLA